MLILNSLVGHNGGMSMCFNSELERVLLKVGVML